MSSRPRDRSPAFQSLLEETRNGQSYQAFVNALTAVGVVCSRSYVKRVEAGTLAPNAALIYGVARLAKRDPGELLKLFVQDAQGALPAGGDLPRQNGRVQRALPSTGGAVDVTAAARIRELEARIEDLETYEDLVQRLRPLLSNALLVIGEEGSKAAGKKARRGRDH